MKNVVLQFDELRQARQGITDTIRQAREDAAAEPPVDEEDAEAIDEAALADLEEKSAELDATLEKLNQSMRELERRDPLAFAPLWVQLLRLLGALLALPFVLAAFVLVMAATGGLAFMILYMFWRGLTG